MAYNPGWEVQQKMRGVERELAHEDRDPKSGSAEDHEEHAAGEVCARCHQSFESRDDVRKNANGEWVHQRC